MPGHRSSREWLARLTRRGPKYGRARGVALYGTAHGVAFLGAEQPDEVGPSSEFTAWAAARGVPLTDDRACLSLLDAHLDTWSRTEMGPALGNEVGLCLGRVLARQVPGARWVVWPNGHPVVRLTSGREVDVVALVHRRLDSGAPPLTTVYDEAMHDEAAR